MSHNKTVDIVSLKILNNMIFIIFKTHLMINGLIYIKYFDDYWQIAKKIYGNNTNYEQYFYVKKKFNID